MRCPYCGHTESKVVDSRPTEDDESIKRRRVCELCGARFTTYETVEMQPIMVVKKDKTREEFDKNKLLSGVIKACHKRPVTSAQLNEMAKDIEMEIRNSYRGEIPSDTLGEMVMDRLSRLDQIAYVRFASVYREFKDVDTFLAELKELKKNTEN